MDGIGDDTGNVRISPDQAIKLMALAQMIKDGDIDFRGHEIQNEAAARAAIADIAQEIALQVHNAD